MLARSYDDDNQISFGGKKRIQIGCNKNKKSCNKVLQMVGGKKSKKVKKGKSRKNKKTRKTRK
jgi:hypothetical protein